MCMLNNIDFITSTSSPKEKERKDTFAKSVKLFHLTIRS